MKVRAIDFMILMFLCWILYYETDILLWFWLGIAFFISWCIGFIIELLDGDDGCDN